MREAVRRNPGLVALLALGLALRLWTMLAYRPAVLGYPDGTEYLINGVHDLWRGIGRPVGYPILIRAVTTLGGGLTALVALQHLLGLATAVVLYWIVRAAGAPRGFACVPAAVVLLSGDQAYIEHSPMSETLFAFLLALARGVRAARGGFAVAGARVVRGDRRDGGRRGRRALRRRGADPAVRALGARVACRAAGGWARSSSARPRH